MAYALSVTTSMVGPLAGIFVISLSWNSWPGLYHRSESALDASPQQISWRSAGVSTDLFQPVAAWVVG